MIHGDDFTTLGDDKRLNQFEDTLTESFKIKVRGQLGRGCPGYHQIRLLKCIARVKENGIEYEADPRHADLMVELLGLKDGKPVVSPCIHIPNPTIETDDQVDGTSCGKMAMDATSQAQPRLGRTATVSRAQPQLRSTVW